MDASRYTEDDLLVAVEAGAEDLSEDEDVFEVITALGDFTAVRRALEEAGIELESAELTYRPSSLVPIEHEGQVVKLMKLIDSLEENDDVSAVHANFDAPVDELAASPGSPQRVHGSPTGTIGRRARAR